MGIVIHDEVFTGKGIEMTWGTWSAVFQWGTSKAEEQEAGQHTISGSVGKGQGSPGEECLGER